MGLCGNPWWCRAQGAQQSALAGTHPGEKKARQYRPSELVVVNLDSTLWFSAWLSPWRWPSRRAFAR